jgi:hypothetical protein
MSDVGIDWTNRNLSGAEVFEHVYESYPERNTGIYATAS